MRPKKPESKWAVWCSDGHRWEWGLTREKADYELAVAEAICDCGGRHRISGEDRDPFAGKKSVRRIYTCGACGEIGHTAPKCMNADKSDHDHGAQ